MTAPVIYLEDSDFNADNSLQIAVGNGKPTVVMVQGAFCGYCTKAKPDFQQLASLNNLTCATIQIDGGPTEKKAAERVKVLYPAYKGVPCFLGFDKNGKFVKVHEGGRDATSIGVFGQSL